MQPALRLRFLFYFLFTPVPFRLISFGGFVSDVRLCDTSVWFIWHFPSVFLLLPLCLLFHPTVFFNSLTSATSWQKKKKKKKKQNKMDSQRLMQQDQQSACLNVRNLITLYHTLIHPIGKQQSEYLSIRFKTMRGRARSTEIKRDCSCFESQEVE